jgi:flagellin
MSSGILLSGGLRSSVNSLTDIGAQISTANSRLSTGKKVNTALDNPGTYFLAKGFETESGNLKALLDNQNLALSSITKATDAFSNITKLTQSVQALVKQAQSLVNTDATNRDNIGGQIRSLFNQIDSIQRDASFNGSNILASASGTAALTATFGNSAAFVASTALNVITNTASTAAAQTTVKVATANADINSATGIFSNVGVGVINGASVAASTTGLTWTSVGAVGATIVDGTTGTTYTAGNFTGVTGDTKLGVLLTTVTQALVNLTVAASATATQATVLQIRQSFTQNSSRTAQSANESLILADLNEEGAALTSLQTRQSFAVTSLQLAGQADKAILRLFG